MTKRKRIFVSGCYEFWGSGYLTFFKEAATYGDLYVGIGSDSTICDLKGRPAINSELERLNKVKTVRYVTDA